MEELDSDYDQEFWWRPFSIQRRGELIEIRNLEDHGDPQELGRVEIEVVGRALIGLAQEILGPEISQPASDENDLAVPFFQESGLYVAPDEGVVHMRPGTLKKPALVTPDLALELGNFLLRVAKADDEWVNLMSEIDALPISALLSKTLEAFSRELDGRRDDLPSLAVWANVLQYIDLDGVDQRELTRLARLSKRALPPVLKPLQRSGHIAVDGKRVKLTPLGRAANEAWPALHTNAERRWRRRFGALRITSLRRLLEHLVSQFELDHPDFPTQYGPADPRVNGGPGQDWKPVPRTPGTPTKDKPLTSLLSQALVEVTMQYDGRAGPLQFAANVLRFLPDKGAPVSGLPDAYWLGTMVRHKFVNLSPDEKTVKIRAISKKLRDAYMPVLGVIEEEWRSRYGRREVEQLRAHLGALVAQVDPNDELPHLMSFSGIWSGAKWANKPAHRG